MAAVAQFDGARETFRSSYAGFVAIVRGLCVGFVMLTCLGLGPAQQPSLRWDAPGECPQAAGVRAKLDELLAESTSEAAVDADGQVQRLSSRRYRLKLQLRIGSHHAERKLESASCDELTATAVWLIAVAIDPTVHEHAASMPAASDDSVSAGGASSERAEQGQVTSHGDGSVSDPLRERASSSAAEREPLPERRSRAGASLQPRLGRLTALAGVSFGTASAPQAELGAAGGLGLGWLYSELELSVLLPRRDELTGGGVVTSWSLELGLRECALWGVRLRWGPCLTLSGLRTVGHAEGLSTTQPDQALFWAVAGAALRAIWSVRERLELSLAGGLGVPISPRPRFTVEGVGEVAPVSAVPGYLRIGVGFATR